jgi:hypothetical protein
MRVVCVDGDRIVDTSNSWRFVYASRTLCIKDVSKSIYILEEGCGLFLVRKDVWNPSRRGAVIFFTQSIPWYSGKAIDIVSQKWVRFMAPPSCRML